MKIIIGDDDRMQLSALKRYLSRVKELEIDEVYDSLGLVEKVRGADYDLVISDNDYNDWIENGGIEAVRKIREFNKNIPVLLQSAELYGDKRKRALEAGATYALQKGELGELVRIIEECRK